MSLLRKHMLRDMERAGLAACTQKEYLAAIRHMTEFLGRDPETLTPDDIRAWDDEMHARGNSPEWIRVHMAALAFLYKKTLGRPEMVSFFAYPGRRRKIPVVLSKEEVNDLLSSFYEMVYWVFFSLIYDTGLRISEAASIKAKDIDRERNVIHIIGKGGKERQVKLGDSLYALLRNYWRDVRMKEAEPGSLSEESLLFVSSKGGRIGFDSARKALKLAALAAGITKKVTPHTLRHTFATHQLESSTDLRIVQVQMGHANISTTEHYLKVSRQLLLKAPSPLDCWIK